jgi:mRNA-degrading endonuclease RelE of RelBE toxin-antitoxin system
MTTEDAADSQHYRIEYTRMAFEHLKGLKAFQRARVLDVVDERLQIEPGKVSRHRKRLRPNTLALWELRIEDLRVFYDIHDDTKAVVIVAIGIKDGNRLLIAGVEVKL